MPTYAPSDLLISPIIAQLTTIINNQIGGVTTVYPTPPAGPPDDSSVVIAFINGSNNKGPQTTIGRLRQNLTFVLMHFFRFNDLNAAYLNCYSYIYSYLRAFESWANQNLQSTVVEINVKDYGVVQKPYAGQPYLVLGMTLEIIKEIPTPIS